MRTPQAQRYAYCRDRDGCDETFDIWDRHTSRVIDSIPFWDSVEGEEEDRERATDREALAAWEEVMTRAGKKVKPGEDLSHAAPFPEALVPPPALLSRHEIPLPTASRNDDGRNRRPRRRGGRRRPAPPAR